MTARAATAYNPLVQSAGLALDQLPMLPVIFERLGTRLGERLRPLANALPHFSLNQLTSESVGEALDGYEMNAIAGVFHAPAWDQRVVVGFDRDFIYTTVEMLFGGDGTEPPMEDIRSFTSIEQAVAKHIFELAAPALHEAFQPVDNVRFRFERLETRIDFAASGRRSNPAVVGRFVMQAINRGGLMFVIVPQAALASLRQALSSIAGEAHEDDLDPQWLEQITSGVQQAEVGVRAVLEAEDYTLGDLSELATGDILKLPATLRSRVRVESNDQPLFWAFIGENEGLHTLRIDEEINAGKQLLSDVLKQ